MKIRTSQNLETIYNSGELVLITGLPGSGKTTLVHKITKDWAKGSVLVNARLVFIIAANSILKEESLSNMLDEAELKDVIKCIMKDDGEGLCFIIDGLDEYQPKTNSIIFRLIGKTYLPKSMVIVSSRPATVKDLKISTVGGSL